MLRNIELRGDNSTFFEAKFDLKTLPHYVLINRVSFWWYVLNTTETLEYFSKKENNITLEHKAVVLKKITRLEITIKKGAENRRKNKTWLIDPTQIYLDHAAIDRRKKK